MFIFALVIQSFTHTCFSFGSRCGNKGIKIACTATSNTVCNDKSEGMV